MIFPSHRVRILLATRPVDFRKGHDGLADLVQSILRKDPFTGTVFVFRSRRRAVRKNVVHRNRGYLPEGLERIERVIEPDSLECPCGCGLMHRIGEDRTERLDIVPAQLRVIVTIRPKYACRTCTDGVTQAPAPPWLIEGGLPTEGAIAHVLVSKYADHLPLYRQSQILARSGIDIHRSTLAGWVGVAAFHLGPVVDRLAEHLKTSTKLFMDETTAPVLDPGRGRTKTGYLWALARDDRAWAAMTRRAWSISMHPDGMVNMRKIPDRL